MVLPMMHRSSRLAAEIEKEVLLGRLAPGQRMPSEEKLCERFGASRTVIREALQHLRGRGLLRTIKGSGTYIADSSLESLGSALNAYSALALDADFMELIGFRILLETECARLAATHADAADIRELRSILERMRGLTGEPARFSKQDIAFHLRIAKASGNRIYQTILSGLEKRCIAYAQANRGDAARCQRVIETHQDIIDAIAGGDPDLAAAAMNAHLQTSRHQYLDHGITCR
jgi:GntR family transcriptional regulator, transcriptional repressor for pyruvate dehydrogenase complex